MSTLPGTYVDELPRSVEDYIALRDRMATTPEGGATMMVLALLLYAQEQELGQGCLAAAVDRERLREGPKGYRGWQLGNRDLQLIRTQLASRPYIPRSYVQGATPENGYQLPPPPYRFAFAPNPHSGDPASGAYKVFVACSGASSPRPVTVHRNDRGIWQAYEWSSLVVGVREPASGAEDEI
jgi:hypothetical protein